MKLKSQPISYDLNPDLWGDRYASILYDWALLKTNDREVALDLVQDTFLAGLEQLATFANKSSEKTWLTAILNYKICHYYRSKKRNIILTVEDFDQLQKLPLNAVGAPGLILKKYQIDHDQLVAKEFRNHLLRFLNGLPELWRSIFEMKYISQCRTELICQKLQISHSNFWVICHRLRARLQQQLRLFLD